MESLGESRTAPNTESSSDPLIGTVLDARYQIEELLGTGTSANVYRAYDCVMQRVVAIKLSNLSGLSADLLSRFKQQAEILMNCRHPNVAAVFAFGISGDRPYISMEFVRGHSLASRIKEGGPLEASTVVSLCLQLCQALHIVHSAGVVHRDLKPGNIIVCNSADGPLLKLLDFGIARVIGSDQRLTRAGTILGSPAYMSPEQSTGAAVDPRSDIYSVGCIMYEALTGHPPFSADSAMELLMKHGFEPPAPLIQNAGCASISNALNSIVLKCLEKRPEDRFANINELSEALSLMDTVSLKLDKSVIRFSWQRKNIRTKVLVLSLLSVSCAIVVAFSITGQKSSSPTETVAITDYLRDADLVSFDELYARSEEVIAKGDPNRAIPLLNACLVKGQQKGAGSKYKAKVLQKMAVAYARLHQPEKAIAYCELSRKTCLDHGIIDYKFEAAMDRLLGTCYEQKKDWQREIFYIRKAIENYQRDADFSNLDCTELLMSFTSLGQTYFQTQQYASAEATFAEAISHSRKLSYEPTYFPSLVRDCALMALAQARQGKLDEAKATFKMYLEKNVDSIPDIFDELWDLADHFMEAHRQQDALLIAKCAINGSRKNFSEIRYIHHVLWAIKRLTVIDAGLAESLIKDTLRSNTISPDSRLRALEALTQILGLKHHYQQIVSVRDQVKPLAPTTFLGIDAKANVLRNIGLAYEQLGNFGQSAEFLGKSFEAAKANESLGNARFHLSIALDLSALYFKRAQIPQAVNWTKRAMEIAERYKLKYDLVSIYGRLGMLYQKADELPHARMYYDLMFRVLDENPELKHKHALLSTYERLYGRMPKQTNR